MRQYSKRNEQQSSVVVGLVTFVSIVMLCSNIDAFMMHPIIIRQIPVVSSKETTTDPTGDLLQCYISKEATTHRRQQRQERLPFVLKSSSSSSSETAPGINNSDNKSNNNNDINKFDSDNRNTYNDDRRTNRSPPPQNPRSYNTVNRSGGGGGGGGGRGGGGGGSGEGRGVRSYTGSRPGSGQQRSNYNTPRVNGDGNSGPTLRLENPRKISRVVNDAPNTEYNDQRTQSRGGQQSRRPVASTAGGASGSAGGAKVSESLRTKGNRVEDVGGATDVLPIKNDAGRRRRVVPGAAVPRRTTEDDRPKRKTSLRVDATSRKGRSAEMVQRRGSLKKRDRSSVKAMKAEAAIERKTIQLPEGQSLTVSQLAEIIDEKPVAVIKLLMSDFGVMASMTQSLDPATCLSVAEGFGKIVAGSDEMDEELLEWETSAISTGVVANDDDDPADLLPRAPVVTIMGHVDHGKTSLLDAIRSTDVTATEAGGITQHIAAYQVKHKGRDITFIDTPGHSAFTDMRERGANITDIVILVVAADDGVKQQTTDSIMCARQAGVPLIVAINKIDKETADPVRVMTELTSYDILTEDLGGDVLVSQISAKQKTNIDDLLDKIMLQAEVEDLKANPNRDAEGIVVEAYVEKGLGTVATTLVKRGTLKVGDVFVAGETYGRVRALLPTTGNERMKEAGPSVPVRVVGFEGVPSAGDIIVVAKDEQTARELAESRKRIAREQSSSSYQAGLMSSMSMAFGAKKVRKEMCVVLKADVQGSAEALTRALRELRLENDEGFVTVKVLVSETGEVTKSDIAIASVTPGTTVIAFNVAASVNAMDDARAAGVKIEYYNIIYDAIESVQSRMQEVLSPTPDGEYVGSAVVQEVFNIGGTGNIAGSRCVDGFIRKGGIVRVMRGDKILIESKIKSLRNFKAETDTVEASNECGIGLVDFEDFQKDDVIECYIEERKK